MFVTAIHNWFREHGLLPVNNSATVQWLQHEGISPSLNQTPHPTTSSMIEIGSRKGALSKNTILSDLIQIMCKCIWAPGKI